MISDRNTLETLSLELRDDHEILVVGLQSLDLNLGALGNFLGDRF